MTDEKFIPLGPLVLNWTRLKEVFIAIGIFILTIVGFVSVVLFISYLFSISIWLGILGIAICPILVLAIPCISIRRNYDE